jgi:hypothetical protein
MNTQSSRALIFCGAIFSMLFFLVRPGWAEPKHEAAPPDFAKKLHSPKAEEVGQALKAAQAPVPGIPLDTSFPCIKWFAQGPGPCTNADANMPPSHPSVGAVQAIVAHPSNPDIVWLAAVNGGVWRCTNATSANYSWTPLTDAQASLSCGAMAPDPADATGQTLVVASGRYSSFGNAGGAQIGVLRTTDGGNTWTVLGGATLANRNLSQTR